MLLNLCLIPGSGIIGAAISTAVSYLLVTLLLGLANYRIAAFRFLDPRLGSIIPIFIGGWGVSLLVQSHTTLPCILAVDLGIIIASALLASFVLLRPAEREYMLGTFREAYSRFKRGP